MLPLAPENSVVHSRRQNWLAFFVLLSAVGSLSEPAAKITTALDPVTAITQARALLSTLGDAAATSRYAEVGREFGYAIDGVRLGNATLAQLTMMREIAQELRNRTIAHQQALEARAGRDEAALEALYRSVAWDDISFALAAFPYWGAWIDLETYKQVKDTAAKQKWLWEAKKGFRGTAIQVFRPSLVYGGWLGLGYVALAEDDHDRAIKIFERLDEVLGGDTGHPLYEVVSLELRILRARTGKVVGPPPDRKIDDTEAQLLRAEAIALFEYSTTPAHKESARRARITSASEAVDRLIRLIDSGYIDNELIRIIVQYYPKIVGRNIDPLTALVRAEQAFEYGHDATAAGQYEKFFATVKNRKDIKLDQFHFRYALASLNSRAYKTAATTADRLLRNKNLDPQIKRAATKLAYVARLSRKATPTASSREALRKSAERLLRDYPDDRDVDGTRLTVAQTTTNSKKAHAMMNAVESPSKLKGSVEQTRYFILARDFGEAIRRDGGQPPTALATKGLSAYKRLPKKQRKISENLGLMLQMRALVDPEPQAVITAIDEAEAADELSIPVRQGMLWARLKSFERLGDDAALIDFLGRLANAGLEGWQLEQIYPPINSAADATLRLSAAQALLSGTTADVIMEQRFKIIVIEAMLELDQYPDAYEQAKLFRQAYPKVGNGYRLVALTAAKMERPVEADRAWRAITDRADPRRDIWWEGMLSRAHIRAESTRPKTACEVLSELESRSEFMPAEIEPKLEALRSTLPCTEDQAG